MLETKLAKKVLGITILCTMAMVGCSKEEQNNEAVEAEVVLVDETPKTTATEMAEPKVKPIVSNSEINVDETPVSLETEKPVTTVQKNKPEVVTKPVTIAEPVPVKNRATPTKRAEAPQVVDFESTKMIAPTDETGEMAIVQSEGTY